MRIGIAQIHTIAGAFDQTVERMVAQSQRAAGQGVELLVFPLAALAGVEALPYADRLSYMADIVDALSNLACDLACSAIVPVPIDLGEPGGHFDALLIEDGEVRPLRPSMGMRGLVDDLELRDEERKIAEVNVGGLRLALAFSHADLDQLDDYDYDVDAVIFLSGYPFALDDAASALGASLEEVRFVDDAKAIGAWLLGVGAVGGYGDQVFSGSSFVLAPSGELRAIAPAFEEALLTCDVQPSHEASAHTPLPPEVYDAPFHLWQAVVLGIHDYVTGMGKQDVALLLDGSLAAMVLLALASDALGPLHVHALVGSTAGKRAPACRELARRLRVDQTESVAATGMLDARDLDELMLAAYAREFDAVVLSSFDKTALGLGLMAGHVSSATLCPLGDVYRSDVLDMAHVRNTISPLFRKVALGDADVFALTLKDGERQIATEHDLLQVDEILLGYVEYDRSRAELTGQSGADADLVDAVLRAVRLSEPWRRSTPPVLAMSTHTLDEARFPLGARWNDERLDVVEAPFSQLAAAQDVAQDSAPENREMSSLPQGMDLEGTLAMLRDLAEQVGFNPVDIAALGQGEVVEGGSGGEATSGPMGWTPFSEN